MVDIKYQMSRDDAIKVAAMNILEHLKLSVTKVDKDSILITLDGRVFTLCANDCVDIMDQGGEIVLKLKFTGISRKYMSPTLFYSICTLFDRDRNVKMRMNAFVSKSGEVTTNWVQ